MQVRGHQIGVCSWSVRPTGMADLVQKLKTFGIDQVHLSLGPILQLGDEARETELKLLRDSGIELTAGMISFPGEDYSTISTIRKTGGVVPDPFWEARKSLAIRAGLLAKELGTNGLSFHAGFVPQSDDPLYGNVLRRVCEIAEPLAVHGVHLLLETGQETASELLQFFNDLRCQNVYANFDPANLILYGAGDPIEAVQTLGRHARHVHLKDGKLSDQPGVKWGKETVLGEGQVPLVPFFDALADVGYTGAVVLESEFDANLEGLGEAVRVVQSL